MKWKDVLADLRPPRLSTPRGEFSPRYRASPSKIVVFQITDAMARHWIRRIGKI